jgi:hypothetical protein
MKRVVRVLCASLAAGAFVLDPAVACAQDPAQALRQEIDQLRREFDALRQQYGDRLTALEQKLAAIQGGSPPPAAPPEPQPAQPTAQVPSGAEGAGGPTGALPVYGGAVAGSKVFNPDMAVIGDFLGALGKNDVHADPFSLGGDHPSPLQMHESEAAFQAVVDPYARADFFISFGEQGVNLEEGYVTFTSLPGGLLTKVGKMRAAFGKVNSLHNHVLPWADRPLVMYNLVGGEDGIADAGISVARLIPNPWLFLEATGQVFRGDSGAEGSPLFQTTRRSELSYVGHLRAYQDLTDNANIDLGASYSRGHNGLSAPSNGPTTDTGSLVTDLYGVDATYRWRPLQRSIYHSFVGRLEWIWSRRDQPLALGGRQNGNGMYVSGDYQFGRRWFAGARYDRSNRPDNASLVDTGGSLVLTYWPSEFSQIRGQYRRTNYADAVNANELLFQFQFSIGAHGAHPF